LSGESKLARLSHLFKDEIGVNVKHYRLDCRLKNSRCDGGIERHAN